MRSATWRCKISRDVEVGFHNLRRYDGHHIMAVLGKVCQEKGLEIDCIAKGMEDYLGFTVRMKRQKNKKRKSDEDDTPFWRIRFIDTAQFMKDKLDNLVKNLGNTVEDFPLTTAELKKKGVKEDHVPLLLSKGVYPYSYMDGWSKFNDTKLPPKEAFLQ